MVALEIRLTKADGRRMSVADLISERIFVVEVKGRWIDPAGRYRHRYG